MHLSCLNSPPGPLRKPESLQPIIRLMQAYSQPVTYMGQQYPHFIKSNMASGSKMSLLVGI